MRVFRYLAVIAIGALSPWTSDACSRGPDDKAFDKVAPAASEIVAVQVLSLSLDPTNYYHSFRGKIRVLKHFRESSDFDEITYTNTYCAGLRVEVGGIYILATNSTTSTIEINSYAAPILHLSGHYTFEPEQVLRAYKDVIERLEAAIRGQGTFEITTPALREELSTERPPPPVPPPPLE